MSYPNGRMQLDLHGWRFDRLVALQYIVMPAGKPNKWRCACDCGKRIDVEVQRLTAGNTRSCGCLHRDEMRARFTKHGRRSTREYGIWQGMIKRCYNRNAAGYAQYGMRGVRVCWRWRQSFNAFWQDVGPAPSPRHSIDRFPDRRGNYEPGNVRWATARQQAQNTKRNVVLAYNGKQACIAVWARRLHIDERKISCRLRRGWSTQEALGKA